MLHCIIFKCMHLLIMLYRDIISYKQLQPGLQATGATGVEGAVINTAVLKFFSFQPHVTFENLTSLSLSKDRDLAKIFAKTDP